MPLCVHDHTDLLGDKIPHIHSGVGCRVKVACSSPEIGAILACPLHDKNIVGFVGMNEMWGELSVRGNFVVK